jgi:hypothetical protein
VQLQETAGVDTTLTGFTFDGLLFTGSIGKFFGSTTVTANGTLTATLKAGNVPAPSSVPLVFTGRDSSGAAWSREIVVPFLPAGN